MITYFLVLFTFLAATLGLSWDAPSVSAGIGPGSPATAFVCQNFTCKAPTRDPAKLRAALAEGRAAPKLAPVLQPVDLGGIGKG